MSLKFISIPELDIYLPRPGAGHYPKTPDMRLPDTQNLTDGEIYYVIHNGIRLTGTAAWGTEEKDDDSWKLVVFIRHLPQVSPPEEREREALIPKGPAEKEEEQEEEQFLNGEPSKQIPKQTLQQHPIRRRINETDGRSIRSSVSTLSNRIRPWTFAQK
jgi:hypothetical protein